MKLSLILGLMNRRMKQMPKIYGSVNIFGSILKCNNCGIEFKSEEQFNKIISGRRATCPLCSVTRGRDIRVPFDRDGKIYIDALETYKSLATKHVTFRCNVCNNNFKVATTYMPVWLDRPKCPICSKNKIDKPQIDTKSIIKTEQNKSSGMPTKNNSDIPNTELDKYEENKSEGFSKYIGKVFNKSFKISYADRNKVKLQCISCGFNLEDRSPKAIKIMAAKNTLICPRCRDIYGNKDILDKIISKYLGKIYNGMIITDIYCDENRITYCDLGCLESKVIGDNGDIYYKHSIQKKDFASVINHEVACPVCSKRKILDSYVARSILYKKCARFTSAIEQHKNIQYIDYNKLNLIDSPEFDKLDQSSKRSIRLVLANRLSINDLLTKDESICKYCSMEDCKDRFSADKKFSNIANEIDFESNIRECVNNVMAEYPTIYSTKDKAFNNYKEYREKGIIQFRKAYTGRNGESYYFCKCINHKTEMILSSSEIEEFSHKECNEEFKQSNSFFDIEEIYLPILSKKPISGEK